MWGPVLWVFTRWRFLLLSAGLVDSPGEFERFKQWIASAPDEGALVEVPVQERYRGSSMFDEHWYRATSGSVWRLVAPEPPFLGVFERVR